MSEDPQAKPNERSIPIEAAYCYCPRCGAKNPNVGEVPFRCQQCSMSSFFGPVAAVGGIVTNDSGEILLVRRARDPGKGCWGLPGGFVDRGETVEHALAREVKEETQLEVTTSRLLMSYPNQYDYRGVVAPVIDLFFCCEVRSPDQIFLAADELDHHVWAHPTAEHLNNMAFHSNRIAIEHLLSMQGE